MVSEMAYYLRLSDTILSAAVKDADPDFYLLHVQIDLKVFEVRYFLR